MHESAKTLWWLEQSTANEKHVLHAAPYNMPSDLESGIIDYCAVQYLLDRQNDPRDNPHIVVDIDALLQISNRPNNVDFHLAIQRAMSKIIGWIMEVKTTRKASTPVEKTFDVTTLTGIFSGAEFVYDADANKTTGISVTLSEYFRDIARKHYAHILDCAN